MLVHRRVSPQHKIHQYPFTHQQQGKKHRQERRDVVTLSDERSSRTVKESTSVSLHWINLKHRPTSAMEGQKWKLIVIDSRHYQLLGFHAWSDYWYCYSPLNGMLAQCRCSISYIPPGCPNNSQLSIYTPGFVWGIAWVKCLAQESSKHSYSGHTRIGTSRFRVCEQAKVTLRSH